MPSDSAGASRDLPAYLPETSLSDQPRIVSDSALTALQARLPRVHADTIIGALSTGSTDDSTDAPVHLPVVDDPQVLRAALQYGHGVSDSAAPRFRPSFFPPDPDSPSPLPRAYSMSSFGDVLHTQRRGQSRSPELWPDVQSEQEALSKRLSEAASAPPGSRASSPESRSSAVLGREDSSGAWSQPADLEQPGRKRSRSPEERDESEVEAGPSKRSRARDLQPSRSSVVDAALERTDRGFIREDHSAGGDARPIVKRRSERLRRR